MKKYIVLSANENPEYLFTLPLTVWTWKKFGWNTIFISWDHHKNNVSDLVFKNYPKEIGDQLVIGNSNDYQSSMLSQVSRLYGALFAPKDEDYVMLGDIDMLALSDYWKFDSTVITAWGRDLTDYHYPMCFLGAPKKIWGDLMDFSLEANLYDYFDRDLKGRKNLDSWVLDQDILTETLLETPYPITHVSRGTLPNGYPVGRVDRSAWSIDHPVLIDCHLPRGMWKLTDDGINSLAKVNRLLEKVWPNENFEWWNNYVAEFRKLVP